MPNRFPVPSVSVTPSASSSWVISTGSIVGSGGTTGFQSSCGSSKRHSKTAGASAGTSEPTMMAASRRCSRCSGMSAVRTVEPDGEPEQLTRVRPSTVAGKIREGFRRFISEPSWQEPRGHVVGRASYGASTAAAGPRGPICSSSDHRWHAPFTPYRPRLAHARWRSGLRAFRRVMGSGMRRRCGVGR